MIIGALLLVTQVVPTGTRVPVKTVEWVDHYNRCLNVNAAVLLDQDSQLDRREVARRATVRCWPVRASARKIILSDLSDEGSQINPSLGSEMAKRLLDNAAKAFALDFGLPLVALGPLDPP